jgi:nitronate monooxygenase
MHFTPRDFVEGDAPPLRRPRFLPIIASNTLAVTMLRKANGRVDGFIIEGPTAGGHNAPPRGKLTLNELGEPVYGERDRVDLEKMRELGVPFWLAGGYGGPDVLQQALDAGELGVEPMAGADLKRCDEVLDRYPALGFVDASVVAMAERLGVKTLATTDRRHFGPVSPRHVPRFTLVP